MSNLLVDATKHRDCTCSNVDTIWGCSLTLDREEAHYAAGRCRFTDKHVPDGQGPPCACGLYDAN